MIIWAMYDKNMEVELVNSRKGLKNNSCRSKENNIIMKEKKSNDGGSKNKKFRQCLNWNFARNNLLLH